MELFDQIRYNNQMLMSQENFFPIADFHPLPSPQHSPEPQNSSSESSQQKNGKWNEIQHAKYIVFMEYHRAEFKSKQQRRAHKFYKQMSAFIKTRNALQCRSHHQKLEDRYCYANKIILAFKQHGNMSLYHSSLQELKQYQQGKSNRQSEEVQQSDPSVQVSSQTEINGVNAQFHFVNPFAKSQNDLWSFPSIFNGMNAGQFLQTPVVPSCQGVYYSYYPNPYYINYL